MLQRTLLGRQGMDGGIVRSDIVVRSGIVVRSSGIVVRYWPISDRQGMDGRQTGRAETVTARWTETVILLKHYFRAVLRPPAIFWHLTSQNKSCDNRLYTVLK